MIKIALLSDTHGFHRNIRLPEGIDMIIHAGDATNNRHPAINDNEFNDFLDWYKSLNVQFKIYVPGNHDTSIQAGFLKNKDVSGIDILIHEERTVGGIKMFGSPWTPTFGVGWAYNKDRSKLHNYWQAIPEDTDVLITHGPPKGILDISENRDGYIEYCGDLALRKRVEVVLPKYHVFGHIHNCGFNVNNGIRKISNISTAFINATMVTDGKFDRGLTSDPIIIEI